jgi:hypothetical protein
VAIWSLPAVLPFLAKNPTLLPSTASAAFGGLTLGSRNAERHRTALEQTVDIRAGVIVRAEIRAELSDAGEKLAKSSSDIREETTHKLSEITGEMRREIFEVKRRLDQADNAMTAMGLRVDGLYSEMSSPATPVAVPARTPDINAFWKAAIVLLLTLGIFDAGINYERSQHHTPQPNPIIQSR